MDLLSSNIVQAAAEAGQCKAAHAEAAKLCKEKSKEIEKLECVLEQAKKDHEVSMEAIASTPIPLLGCPTALSSWLSGG